MTIGNSNRCVGIVFGVKNVVIDSDGHVFENPPWIQKSQRHMDYFSNKLRTNPVVSPEWESANKKRFRAVETYENRARYFARDVALYYGKRYDTVFLPDSKLYYVSHDRKLFLLDETGTDITSALENDRIVCDVKLPWVKQEIIDAFRRDTRKDYFLVRTPYKSDQVCSQCGHSSGSNIVKTGHETTFKCKNCGYKISSDFNTAKIIKKRGIDLLRKMDANKAA